MTEIGATTRGPAPADRPADGGLPAARARAALAGVLAVAAALGLSELAAGLLGGSSMVAAVGGVVIDLQPPGAKDAVVRLFGQNDKLALELLVVGAALAIGAAVGLAARRRFAIGAAVIGAFAVGGFAAAQADPASMPAVAVVVAAVAAVAGVQSLAWLLARAGPAGRPGPAGAVMADWSRRGFLIRGGSLAAASVAAGVLGRRLLDATRTPPTTGAVAVPRPAVLAGLPAGAELAVDGLSPLVVPNDAFYRIDTALLVPDVDVATWSLRVHGLVDRETQLTFRELVELPLVEQYVTIACVSNEVGGDLVGNAKWTGVPLREVLGMAGVQPAASQLVGRSVDGWTAGMPTAWVMDPAREPLIAVLMNDELLPKAHGFPARLIVPGLFGYVSATKWLAELELTTLEAFDAYWVPLGWAKEGPILTQSRIDVPRPGQVVPAGRVAIAGVAWAPDRGISRVEVAIDGAWRDARLSTPISGATWVQWQASWDAAAAGPGGHRIEVRATDGRGEVQTAERSQPAPDGARGHHRVEVTVA